MAVPILSCSAWREFRGVPGSRGVNSTTHLANIADASGKLHSCYVKLLRPDTPALLCEALGWSLAQSVGLPTPAFGAIVLVPLDALRECMTLPAWTDGKAISAAWCSEVVTGASVRQVHKWAFWVAREKRCLLSKEARVMAAFDIWTDNRDRNFGNVIRSPQGRFVAIDHETLLHDLLWVPMGIEYAERSLFEEAKKRLSHDQLKRFTVDVAAAASIHEMSLEIAQASLTELIDKLHPSTVSALSEKVVGYLKVRAKAGWLANDIGVIA
jgi:hypothetical protein